MEQDKVYSDEDFNKLMREIRRRAQGLYEIKFAKTKDEYSEKEKTLQMIKQLELMLVNKDRIFDSKLIFIEMMALTDDYLTKTRSI
jgi:hypothetical protein